MRVRNFQTYLASQQLVHTNHLKLLRGTRVGLDAVYWLRTLPHLKDPLAEAIGGLPPSIFAVLDHTLLLFKGLDILPLLVFQGLAPQPHGSVASHLQQQTDDAWRRVAQGDYFEAQHKFALASSRINSDFTYAVMHYLQAQPPFRCETFQAPYFAGAQLAYFRQQNLIDAVFGPPSLILFGVPRVIMGINFAEATFEWIDATEVLAAVRLSLDELTDACLLAGTEYSLTFPYLSLSNYSASSAAPATAPPAAAVSGSSAQFQFAAAVAFIRQAPLIAYLQISSRHFAAAEVHTDQMARCAMCKALIRFPLALHLDGIVRPIHVVGGGVASPRVMKSAVPSDPRGEERHGDLASASEACPAGGKRDSVSGASGAVGDNSEVGAERRSRSGIGGNSSDAAAEVAKLVGSGSSPDATARTAVRPPTDDNVVPVPTANHAHSTGDTTGSTPSPVNSTTNPTPSSAAVPDDFQVVVGHRLSNEIFVLMARSLLARKLPSVLANGEWVDAAIPAVDSVEYRDLLGELREIRCRATGLIAMRLHPFFRTNPIRFYSSVIKRIPVVEALPNCAPGMHWNFTLKALEAELNRQAVPDVSFRFCLRWHANELAQGRRMFAEPGTPHPSNPDVPSDGPVVKLNHFSVIRAVQHFLILENLGYFTPEGGITVFGSALSSTVSSEFEQDTLFALELMKCGDLMGDALQAPPDRAFPDPMNSATYQGNETLHRHILLLTRVVSLVPMSLTSQDLWLASVDCDLAAYHTIIKALKKTLRYLSEACLANQLLLDMSAIRYIPSEALSPLKNMIPSFILPRNCLGIVFKHFLEADAEIVAEERRSRAANRNVPPQPNNALCSRALSRRIKKLEVDLMRFYPCCSYPMRDIFKGIRFWIEIVDVIEFLSQNIDVSVLKADMEEAHEFLMRRIVEVGLQYHPLFHAPEQSRLRAQVKPLIEELAAEVSAPCATHSTTTAANRSVGVTPSSKRDDSGRRGGTEPETTQDVGAVGRPAAKLEQPSSVEELHLNNLPAAQRCPQ